MKYKLILLIALTGSFSSCNNCSWPLKCKEISWDGLRGTQWKLEYIVDMTGGSYERVILAPQDCDTCFTLTFDAEKNGTYPEFQF